MPKPILALLVACALAGSAPAAARDAWLRTTHARVVRVRALADARQRRAAAQAGRPISVEAARCALLALLRSRRETLLEPYVRGLQQGALHRDADGTLWLGGVRCDLKRRRFYLGIADMDRRLFYDLAGHFAPANGTWVAHVDSARRN